MAETDEKLHVMLRRLRHRAGLTLETLEEASGISVRTISDLERGHSSTPHRRTIVALAEALVLSAEEQQRLLAAARLNRLQRQAGRSADGPPGVAGLPRIPADFVGRAAELARLRELARPGKPALLITGPAGTGKTTLATHAARLLAADFPDGVLFAGLRGMSERPASAEETLARLLPRLGVAPEDVPADPTSRRALYLDLLGQKSVLVVLDDVADEEQARPLLGVGSGTVTMVTGRRRLAGLDDVSRLAIGTFSAEEAAELLRTILADPDDAGADLDERTAAEIARLCGHLPLAMRIAGNRLRARPAWTARDLAVQLADEERRLHRLVAGDVRVTTAFALSYRQLSPIAAQVFRRLALIAGPDAGTALASVVADTPPVETEDSLDELVELGLLQSDSGDRHYFHDLVRLFARERLVEEEPAAEREASALRLTQWLLTAATTAGRWFEGDGEPGAGLAGGLRFGDAEQASAWLRAEADNWLAAMRSATAGGQHRMVIDTAEAMHWFSDYWAQWDGWEETFTLGRDGARALGDLTMEATHTNYLAWVHLYRRDDKEGLRQALAGLALAERAGDRVQQAWALEYASSAANFGDRFDAGLDYALRAAKIFEELGDYSALCQSLLGIGHSLRLAGRSAEALEYYERTLRIAEDPASPMLEAATRQLPAQVNVGMGRALAAIGQVDEALARLGRGAEAAAAVGMLAYEAGAWLAQGQILRQAGRVEEARVALTRAERIFREAGVEHDARRVRDELAKIP